MHRIVCGIVLNTNTLCLKEMFTKVKFPVTIHLFTSKNEISKSLFREIFIQFENYSV